MSRTKRCEVCGQKKLKVICITCVEKDMKNWEKKMVQKGKLEERKMVLELIDNYICDDNECKECLNMRMLKLKLQKEGGMK